MFDNHLRLWLTLLFLVGTATPIFGQSVNFEDGFDDGDFTSNPTWSGDTDEFTVIDGTPNFLLQLDGDVDGGISYLSTPSADSIGSWEFYIDLDFSPSGGNYAEVFLMSDIANLEGPVNGYALRAGEDGSSDIFRIMRYDNGLETATVLSGTTDISNGGAFRVKVNRSSDGQWSMEVAEGYDGILSPEGGVQTDAVHTFTDYFGVRATYTSSRADLFTFDFKIDLPPFSIVQTSADGSTVDVTFNRPYDQATVEITDFSLNNGLGNPASLSFKDSVTLALHYGSLLPSGRYELTVNDISDRNGETIAPNTTPSFINFGSYSSGDVILNEFAYDPPSSFEEYIEIKNTSGKYLNLQDWQIHDETGFGTISTDPVVLAPDSFLVVSSDTSALLATFGNGAYVPLSSLPSLNNSGDIIRLVTNSGVTADSLHYTSSWGGDGHALERRTAGAPSIYKENWGNSPDPTGGTAGRKNDITADTEPPKLNDIDILSAKQLQLSFNERLDSTATDLNNYLLSGIIISTVSKVAPDTVELTLSTALHNAENYQLTLSGMQDIFGNTASRSDTTFTYYKVSAVDSGDVFINEFMYEPPEGTSEYIELYNPSKKTLDLQEWTLNDNTGNKVSITDHQYLLPPDSLVVLTTDSTLLADFPSASTIIIGSKFPSLNNSGDAIVLRDSSGTLLDSLQYRGSWGEQQVALERRSIELSGTYQANWGLPKKGKGSPGIANTVPADHQAPVLSSFEIVNEHTLQLSFSEELQPSSLDGGFSVSSKIQIEDHRYLQPDTVRLSLTRPLQDATSYTLTIASIEDLFGNKLSKTDTLFTYYRPIKADSGQVFINEFNYNPAEGETEYIEIYNPTNHTFDLQKWTLSDNRNISEIITPDSFILPPDSYIVIAPDNTLQQSHSELKLIPMGSRFPALNNNGDDIVIRNAAGTRLDSLQFTSSWGGEESPLERRTTAISGIYSENWGIVPDGSPGKSNGIREDVTPPKLTNAAIVDNTKLQLLFSERLTAGSATDFANYRISPVRNIQLISAQSDSVTLFLSQPLQSEREYTITTSGMSDIFGNKSSKQSKKITYIHLGKANRGDIVINEIMANPDANTPEFVELYNRSNKNIELAGWTFGDAVDEITMHQNILLKSHQYLIITGSPNFVQTRQNAVSFAGFPNLNNAEDRLFLRNKSSTIIDSLHYRSSWGNYSSGRSLERKDPMAASNDPANWSANISKAKGSAGSQNSVFQEDTTPPNVIFANIRADGRIELYFDEFITLTDDLQFGTEGAPLKVDTFNPASGNRIILQKSAATASTITVQNLTDIRENITPTATIPLAHPPVKGDLIINEIMYNPLDEGDDNKPDQSEYVELYNTRDYALSLEGLVLHDAPDEDGKVRKLQPVSTTAKWVKPGKTVLIYADEASAFNQSKIATFFDLKTTGIQDIIRIERSSLSLASTGDAIYIADSTGTTIDSVYYDEEWHNPNLIDTRGIALERISPGGASDQPANWSSSVHLRGGTPKAKNSIYQENPGQLKNVGISFTPNPFSPDGDGYEDNLIISYKLDQPDYLLRVNIFDRYGRHIKELANGKPAGYEGQLIWDGRRDGGQRNRIGIYIIVFEAINSASGSDKAFKKTVVIARKLN